MIQLLLPLAVLVLVVVIVTPMIALPAWHGAWIVMWAAVFSGDALRKYTIVTERFKRRLKCSHAMNRYQRTLQSFSEQRGPGQ